MSRSKAQVVSIIAEREAQESKKAFLEMLHDDLSRNPNRVEPIPASLFERMDKLLAKAKANRDRDRTEQLEG